MLQTQQIFDFPVTPRFSFDNFVVCSGNKAAYHFARKLGDPAEAENLLYLYGPPGSGKTHLIQAVGTQLKPIYLTPGNQPYFSYKNLGPDASCEYGFADRFQHAPALLLDDIHLLPDTEIARLELWQLFNDFYTTGKKIVIAGLYPPKELPNLDDHLISRLLWGLVAKVDVSDDESRRMIMKKLAEDRQVFLPADVIDYLLVHTSRDIPSLVAILETLRHHALASKRKITVRLAKEALNM